MIHILGGPDPQLIVGDDHRVIKLKGVNHHYISKIMESICDKYHGDTRRRHY